MRDWFCFTVWFHRFIIFKDRLEQSRVSENFCALKEYVFLSLSSVSLVKLIFLLRETHVRYSASAYNFRIISTEFNRFKEEKEENKNENDDYHPCETICLNVEFHSRSRFFFVYMTAVRDFVIPLVPRHSLIETALWGEECVLLNAKLNRTGPLIRIPSATYRSNPLSGGACNSPSRTLLRTSCWILVALLFLTKSWFYRSIVNNVTLLLI